MSTASDFSLETKIAMLKACDSWRLEGIGNKGFYVVAPLGHLPGQQLKECYDLSDDKAQLYTTDCKGNYKLVCVDMWTYDCCPEHNKSCLT